jgi:hypothetical protein
LLLGNFKKLIINHRIFDEKLQMELRKESLVR